MDLEPRTPVLVGVAAVQQREEDPALAREPVELMIEALEAAASDAGSRVLLARADSIRIPRGLWGYRDPGRLIAERLDARRARTLVAEVGVLQTALLGGAAADIASGRADVVLVAGGEAKYRQLRAARTGVAAPLTAQGDVEPDTVLRPHGAILSELEIRHGLGRPVSQYALIENALRAAEKLPLDVHLRQVAETWSAMSRVAVANPAAWRRERVDADTIRVASPSNPMLAFPYTKLHNSQWNVDQAAGLVFTSVATARALGIPRERWIFPWALADANHMLPLSERREMHRSPGFAEAAAAALAGSGLEPSGVDHLELYSCFPVAVRVQTRELRIPESRTLTVTGGMAFAGGPLNNFVLQAQVAMARRLRREGGTGLVTAVSGILTKQGVGLWSAEPGPGFRHEDVSDAAARATARVEVATAASGPARIASWTVVYERGAPLQSVAVCDLPDGRRAIASSPDPELADAMTREELCGRAVRLGPGGFELV